MNKRMKQILAGVVFFVAGLLLGEKNGLQLPVYIASYLFAGGTVILKALRNIRRGRIFDESFLMSVATIGAFFIHEYPEAIAVMLFYQIGEYFQDYAVDKSRKSIKNLIEMRPDYANLKVDGRIEIVNPDEVKPGDYIVIKAGERIPLDAVVVEGTSYVDVSALTGEALPKEVQPGSELLSGSINLGGLLLSRTTKEFGTSTFNRILDLVENASSKKSRQEQYITKFARYYTPIVVGIGLMLATVPPIVFSGQSFQDWIYRALAFLVVSCPCALVVSVPLSFFAGIGSSSKSGILVKGGNYLETLSKVDTVVFDKTGTLTKGVFEVHDIMPIKDYEKDYLLEMAAYAEAYSSHPISNSLKKAYGHKIDDSRIGLVEEIAGLGLLAYVDGNKVLAGNSKLMEKMSVLFSNEDDFGTYVHVAINDKYVGCLIISDELKKDALEAIAGLRKAGIKKIVMLTGDSEISGKYVADSLSLDEFYTNLLPSDKVERLEMLLTDNLGKGKVIFVGDGVNDAPVLARSDVGIAMGALGRDAAIEAADIVIMDDKLSKIVLAIGIAKKTVTIANVNIFIAIGVKVIVLIFSALGLASLWAAVFADVGVTLIAVFNSLRALNIKRNGIKTDN